MRTAILLALLGGAALQPALAQTWLSSPGSGDWNTASNWDTSTVPNGSSATATFGLSSVTSISNNTGSVTLLSLLYNSGASSYVLANSLGTFVFQGAGVVDSSGAAQEATNSGILLFQNASSAGDWILTNSHAVTFTGTSTAGTASITNQAAILEFDTNATAGNSTLNNQGGLVLFLNSSSAGQANLTNSGSVSFGDSSTAGSATLVNNNSGNMVFDGTATGGNAHITNAGNLTFQTSAMAGSAVLNNAGTGTINFYGSSTASAASITNSGTLAFNNNSSAAGAVIGNSNILDFNDSAMAANAQIANTGILNFISSSTAGAATITNSGTLAFNNNSSAAGAVITTNNGGKTVFEPGTSGGAAQLTTNAGGVLDLSNLTGGTLGIGSYTQAAGGTLKMALGAGTPAQLAVTGNATLAGNLDLVYGGGFSVTPGNSVTILTAGSLSGLFDQWNNPQGGRLFPFYPSSNLVYLETVLPSFQIAGLTANQTAIAQALDNAFEDRNRYNLIASVVTQSASSLPALYSQMDPAGLTSFYQMGFRGTHAWTGMVFHNLEGEAGIAGDTATEARKAASTWFAADIPAAEEKALAPPIAQKNDWKVSFDTYGDFGTLTGDGNSQGYKFTIDGLMADAQYQLSGDWTTGICLGYSQGSANPDNGGEADLTGGEAGLFAAWYDKGFHAEALVGAGLNQAKTQRNGYGGTAAANANGEDYTGRIGLGYGFRLDELKVKPYASAEYTYVQLNAFNESGSLAPLSFPAQGEGALLSDLGFSVEQDIKWGTALLTPGLEGAWEHAYQANPDGLTAGLGGPSESFTVQGPATSQDAVVLGAHLEAAFQNFATLYGKYNGRIGLTNYAEQGLEFGIKTVF